MARPAASSAARLMRKPELRRSIDSVTLPLTAVRLRWALNASTLFWIRRDIVLSLNRPGATPCRPVASGVVGAVRRGLNGRGRPFDADRYAAWAPWAACDAWAACAAS